MVHSQVELQRDMLRTSSNKKIDWVQKVYQLSCKTFVLESYPCMKRQGSMLMKLLIGFIRFSSHERDPDKMASTYPFVQWDFKGTSYGHICTRMIHFHFERSTLGIKQSCNLRKFYDANFVLYGWVACVEKYLLVALILHKKPRASRQMGYFYIAHWIFKLYKWEPCVCKE
jgi:hypothetical protein